MNDAELLEVRGVRQAFPKGDGGELLVLDGVEVTLAEGQIVGLLGRSGSGKTAGSPLAAAVLTMAGVPAGMTTPPSSTSSTAMRVVPKAAGE